MSHREPVALIINTLTPLIRLRDDEDPQLPNPELRRIGSDFESRRQPGASLNLNLQNQIQGTSKCVSENIEDTGSRHVVVFRVEGILVTRFMKQGIFRTAVGAKQKLTINRTGDNFIDSIGFNYSEST